MLRLRCCRPEHKSDSIEYQLSDSQLSFLLCPSSSTPTQDTLTEDSSYSSPSLIIYPSNATLKLILSQEEFINLASKYFSNSVTTTGDKQQDYNPHFEFEGDTVDENIVFSAMCFAKELTLVINDNIRLKFHASKRLLPSSDTIDQHRKGLFNRLPIDNGHRPQSDEHHIYPNESLDLEFDTMDGEMGYLIEYLKTHCGERHPFTTYPIQQQNMLSDTKQWNEWETGIYQMHGDADGTVNIALAADWGAGTMESALVASAMMNGLDLTDQQLQATSDLPHYSIHLGDVYYVGLPTEIQHCCLGIKPHWAERGVRWPIGQNGSFTIPGNHELYSRGFGYWDYFLPQVGLFNPDNLTSPVHPQTTSYWVLENDLWRIIGLDTGYESLALLTADNASIKLPDELMEWLKTVVGLSPEMTDKRGLVFVSHHQVLSAWKKKPKIDFPEQIASLLPEGRTVLYLWGHEHRLSFYEKQTVQPQGNSGKTLTLYGRCVGNSGFPTLAAMHPSTAHETKLLLYDDRLFTVQGKDGSENMAFGFNGYVTMQFIRPQQSDDISLYLSYKTLTLNNDGQLTADNPTVLVNEQWSVDTDGNVLLSELKVVNPEITKTLRVDMDNPELTPDA